MSTPICHRTLGPDYMPGNESFTPDGPRPVSYYAEPRPCIGSQCMLWVRTGTGSVGFCADNPASRIKDPRP